MAPELSLLFEHPQVWRVAKALDLSYDFAHLLLEAKIVADIRPVFNRAATRVEAAVVSFTLRLLYDNNRVNHDVSIAMNHSDVQTLIGECERALREAELATNAMNKQAQIRTIITGLVEQPGSRD